MSDSDKISQDEIEDLLRQAQAAAGIIPQPQAAARQPAAVAKATARQPAGSAEPPAGATAPPAAAGAAPAGDDVSYLLAQAQQALASVDQPVDPALSGISPYALPELAGTPASEEKATLELLRDVDLDLRIELGRTQMFLEDVLKLRRGSVVPLDKLAGDPVDIVVNGRLIARGEVLVLNDNFCVRVAELLSGDDVK
jgi:flagellar motor switch protein FliN/FliY